MKAGISKPITIVAIFSFFLISCGSSGTVYDNMFKNVGDTEQHEIMALARMDSNFSTFVQLVDQAGLDFNTEFRTGPITVFIPTNEAFENLDKARYERLTNPQNRAELRRVLMRHILPTEVPSTQFNRLQIMETAVEEEVNISTNARGNLVRIGGATIVKSDIPAANGIIHIVDAVIQPTSDVVPY